MRSRSRSGPILNSAALIGLVTILALVALVTQAPTPPSIAEFAPQAVDVVEDAPSNQSSQFGAGGSGVCAPGTECGPGDGPGNGGGQGSDQTIDAARVKRCVGNPPRQIEDPQSPPCADHWKGDNGGATARGVSRDEIKVVVTQASHPLQPDPKPFVDFVNRRFEFYGRKLTLYTVTGCGAADAVKARDEIGAFAASMSINCRGGTAADAFSERAIVTVDYPAGYKSEREVLGPRSPYLWTYLPALDKIQQNLGEFVCSSIAGRSALYAGPGSQALPRVLGVVLGRNGSQYHDGSILLDRLEECRASPRVVMEMNEFAPAGDGRGQVAKLRSEGVTTVICLCITTTMIQLGRYSSDANYFPEWLLSGVHKQDQESGWGGTRPDQKIHYFGMATIGKSLPLPDRPWYWAYRESLPDSRDDPFTGGAGGVNNTYQLGWAEEYSQILLLASGIQQAGPRLNPRSFEEGLLKTRFPNPGAAGPPYYQGRVGFGPNDHSMVEDYALIWWSDAHESKNYHYDAMGGGRGTFCFVNQGTRYSLGNWPKGEQAFFDAAQGCH